MARVQGVDAVARSFRQLAAKVGSQGVVDVIVGFSANYAVHVHENIEMKWKGRPRKGGKGNYWDPPGRGQAKFLEEPARIHAKTLAEIVKTALARGAKLVQALYLAGLRLQRESQLLVPVDSGFLRASAFTRIVQ